MRRLFLALSTALCLFITGQVAFANTISGDGITKPPTLDYTFAAKFKHDFNKKNPKVPFKALACWKSETSGIMECIVVEKGTKADACGSIFVDSKWPKGYVNQALRGVTPYTCSSIKRGITGYQAASPRRVGFVS